MAEDSSQMHTLAPKFVFGLTPGLADNCLFLNDDKIIYHATGVLVVHDTSTNSQKFMHLNEPQKTVTTMALNNGKNIVAVAVAETGKRPSVSVFDLTKYKLVLQLTVPLEMRADGFMKLKFSCDDVYLAALSGRPDYVMYYFNWKQSKIDSYVQVVRLPTIPGPVIDMALHPTNSGFCCFVGKGLFRAMAMGELVWKQYGFHKANKFEFTSVCWMNVDRVLAGTVDGRLFLVERGELKAIFFIQTLIEFDPNLTMSNPLNVRPRSIGDDMEIKFLLPVKNGLMFVANGCRVVYYKIQPDNKYRKSVEFVMPKDEHLEEIYRDSDKGDSGDGVQGLHVINTLSVSPKSKTLVCVTKRSQLFWASMAGKSYVKMDVPYEVPIEPFGATLHHGGVRGLSVAHWKPVFVTCGTADRTVKMWNHAKCSLLWTQNFAEDVLDVSLDPSGLYAVVALAGRVQFCAAYADGLRPRREYDVAGCRLTRFSTSGHMFAVVDGLTVDVYCTVTSDKRFSVTGHEATLTDVVWATDDWKLYSCDEDGRVCLYNLYTNKEVVDIKFQDQVINGIAVSNDSKQIYTVSEDGKIRELYYRTVIRNKSLDHGPLDAVLLSRSNLALLVACQYGALLSLSLPIRSKIRYKEFSMQNRRVSKMRLTMDDTTLITCSVDGTICVWDVKSSKEKIMHANVKFADETLVSSEYLRNKVDAVVELNTELKRLAKSTADDAVEIARAHEKRLNELGEGQSTYLKRLRKDVKEMTVLNDENIARLKHKINVTKEQNESNWQMVKDGYEEKLIYEDNRYLSIEKEMFGSDKNFKKRTEMLIATHKTKIQEMTDKLCREIQEKENVFQTFREKIDEEKRQITTQIDEFDDQGDRELLELNAHYAVKFRKLKQKVSKVQKESDVFKAKAKSIKKKEEEIRFLVDKFREDIDKMKISNSVLDGEIAEKEAEIVRCLRTLKDRENKLAQDELAKKDLEKQLIAIRVNNEKQKSVVGPLEESLEFLEEAVRNMKMQSQANGMATRQLQYDIEEVQGLIRYATNRNNRLKKLFLAQTTFLTSMQIDIHYIFMNTDKERLKETIRKLYIRYTTVDLSKKEMKSNLFRQRRFLETCKDHLETYKMTVMGKKPSYIKLIEENTYLLETHNKMQMEAKINRIHYDKLVCKVQKKKRKLSNISKTLTKSELRDFEKKKL